MTQDRGPWYLLTGLVLGFAIGLAFAWLVQPVQYVDTTPASLRQDFKDHYRALIASAYAANHDLVRARARLALLSDDDIYRALAEQAQHTLAGEGSPEEARSLGLLAIALGQDFPLPDQGTAPATALPTPTQTLTPTLTPTETLLPTDTSLPSVTPTDTETPVPPAIASETIPAEPVLPSETPTPQESGTPTETPRPRPTHTRTTTPSATPTPGGPFVFVSQEKICSEKLPQPLIQIMVTDRFGRPLPSIRILLTWQGGQQQVYTGLKPEISLGYADLTIDSNTIYALYIGNTSEPVAELNAVRCQVPGELDYWGAWLLKFIQLEPQS